MLSPGQWYKQIPKERNANLRFRRSILRACKGSPKHQAAMRQMCSEDILAFVNLFVWQYNPRKKGGGEVGPFITWDFQEEAVLEILRCIEEDEDLLIEKSREMGASWLCLLVMDWLATYRRWQKFLCISRNENAVEDDDPDSLFWKLDFVHRYLPDWLKPKLTRRKLFFGYDDTDSTITGQASTGKAGVGGRATAMFVDEFSQIKEDYEVLHRTSDTTGCRIFNGTHRGQGTAFYELSRRVDMKKLVMHWTQHPDKKPGLYQFNPVTNQIEIKDKSYEYPADFNFVMVAAPAGGPYPGLRAPWYDRECLRKGSPRAVAMDLDIDAGGSVAQFFNPLTVRILEETYACEPFWEGDVSYDKETGKPLGLVKLPGGPLKLWLHPRPDGSLPSGKYGAGADLSTGMGATNSVLSVAAASGEKVAEYAVCTVQPKDLAPVYTAICWLFKDTFGDPAYFGWEHHGPGIAFGSRVMELSYPRIYWRESSSVKLGNRPLDIPGWYPSNDAKRLVLEDYRGALEGRQFVNHCAAALRECLPYHYDSQGNIVHPEDVKSDDPTGARVNHGDRVIADALAWKMVKSFGILTRKEESEEAPPGSLAWRRKQREKAAV